MAEPTTPYAAFRVSTAMHAFTKLVMATGGLWRRLGDLETLTLQDRLETIPIRAPIYVTGLARAGTTVVLEILAAHPDVVTHRYRDFPLVALPWWWNQFLDRSARGDEVPRERAHADTLAVTSQSPEAMEEMHWMLFFPHAHDSTRTNVLDASTTHPAFERFYRDHVRKLLLLRGGARYAAKGNYNVSRLEYLLRLFPDARIVVPVRHPVDHVASLQKQQALFSAAAAAHPRSVSRLDASGHFEFGAHRRAINVGNDAVVRRIDACWAGADAVRGWACYWAAIYGYVAERVQAHPALRTAVRIVRYEDFCRDTEPELRRLLDHCALEPVDSVIEQFRDAIVKPTYYSPRFSATELQAIAEETASTALLYGYDGETVQSDFPLVS